MKKQLGPVRYMIVRSDDDVHPLEFITAIGCPIIGERRLPGGSISTPNLTGRIAGIVRKAEHELQYIQQLCNLNASYNAHRLTGKLNRLGDYAAQRIHYAEQKVWGGWFKAQYRAARAANDYVEWDRLSELQYNGRAPF